jgi:hypothetical protein
VESVNIEALYNSVGVFRCVRRLQRRGASLEAGKRCREIEGNKRIYALDFEKSNSLPSGLVESDCVIPCSGESITTGFR